MVDFQYKDSYGVKDLEEIVRLLRAPGGCPWDAEQTHQSIRRNFLEEAYEAVEAIDEGSPEHLKEELGDVLLQVVFHALMEQEAGRFDLDAVADGICKSSSSATPTSLGRCRSPAPARFSPTGRSSSGRKRGRPPIPTRWRPWPAPLPALWRAEKVQKKAKKAGFDWPDVSGALDKLSEELEELKTAVAEGTNVEEELGDLLFSAVNVSRFVKVDTEEALNGATDKFIGRFRKVEEEAARQGRALEGMSLAELDKLWEHAKET